MKNSYNVKTLPKLIFTKREHMKHLLYTIKRIVCSLTFWYIIIGAALSFSFLKNNLYLTAFNSLPSFGKTHFIVGYKEPANAKQKKQPSKQDNADTLAAADVEALFLEKRASMVLFSPDDDMHAIVLSLIEHEQEAINIAIFTFTDAIIAQALIKAQERGVTVTIITDRTGILDRYNKIESLYENGAKIYVYNPNHGDKKRGGLMHNKFIIFTKNIGNRAIVWTGSYNLTRSARWNNQENVVIFNRRAMVRKFIRQYEILLKRSDVYRPLFHKQT